MLSKILPLLLLLLFPGCFSKKNVTDNASPPAENDRTAENLIAMNEAARIAAALDDRQLAAQVIISGIDGKGQLTGDMKLLLSECPVGGIMLFRYNLDTDNDMIRNLIAESSAADAAVAAIPPFVAADHEGGKVNRFRAGVADIPPAAFYWEMAQDKDKETAIEHITADSFNAGKEIYDLGINMNFAPVAEYLNKDNRDFLEDRSYGPNSTFTAEAASAFIAGMNQAGILCVVKHFPGTAGTDPHYFPSVLNGDRAALEELTVPIAALIRNGYAQAIMISHSAVPAWDSEIASLSPVIMGGWLRQELGFEGIIISDDFSMASARGTASAGGGLKPEAAAVLSLAAGADMVLVWPPDLRRTHRAIVTALDDGRLSRERLREAAQRIIFEKIQMKIIPMGNEE